MNKIALVGLGVLGVAMLGIAGVFGHGCGKNAHYVGFEEGCSCDEGYHWIWYNYNNGRGVQSWCGTEYGCSEGYHQDENSVCIPDGCDRPAGSWGQGPLICG